MIQLPFRSNVSEKYKWYRYAEIIADSVVIYKMIRLPEKQK